MDLTGKVALITGAKRIGAYVASELAMRGADVVVGYWESRDEAMATADAVRGHGRRGLALRADLSRPDACRRLVDESAQAMGGLDVLVALASRYVSTPLETLDEEGWNASLAVDLSATFHCARAALTHLRPGTGRIIFCADTDAASGRPRQRGFAAHFVAKSAVIALGKALALELAPQGILVNTVALGPILPTPDTTPDDYAAIAQRTPVGKWGGPREVAALIADLITRDYMTGEVVRLDGGLHLA